MQETQVWSLGGEDLLEKEMPIVQYSCLGNPIDRGAWQATAHGVAKGLDTTERLNNRYVKSKCILTNSQIFIIFIKFINIFQG